MARWTEADLTRVLQQQAASVAPPRPTKYHSQRVTLAGHTFDSKREAARYHALTLMQTAGLIRKLECQPAFHLHTLTPAGEWVKVGRFTPDFRYETAAGDVVVEDVKSPASRTEAYCHRRRHWEAETGQRLHEVE